MVSVLGSPQMPLTTNDQPNRASDRVQRLRVTEPVTSRIRVTGIKPAVSSLREILNKVGAKHPDLIDVLGTAGMLNVRLRKPTSGAPSKLISNHAWGTAIDFNIDNREPPGNTGNVIPKGIALLVPFFNDAGWFSGIDFQDDMHFEVSDQTMRKWASDGEFDVQQ
jgi:hypothetical protein